MKIVIAPDKFKGTLTSFEFCDIFESTFQKLLPKATVISLPLADGGDGTIDIAQHYLGGEFISKEVRNAYGVIVNANYLYSESTKTAFIEMAEASGMKTIVHNDLNVKEASTFGTGELILDAINKGAETIILGLGGSATNDCGIGMAKALGYCLLDESGNEVVPIGKNLPKITKITSENVHTQLFEVNFKIACDVTNPLYGSNGASYVYAKQKGASDSDIELLENGMQHFSKVLDDYFNINTQEIIGGGAAGGMGVASKTFLNGELISGIELVKELSNFNAHIKNADWILTGEGMLDEQTKNGKTIQGILSVRPSPTKIAVFCGKIAIATKTLDTLNINYAKDILSIAEDLNDALTNTKQHLHILAEQFVKNEFAEANFAKS
ncbi:glycerate kinase [Tenacibaculum amylolyticum]|uniref:glycerate kinase n=1 Tax=Tenacibaculum amylolyticum TaxID=104269 RepID=UPI0038951B1F